MALPDPTRLIPFERRDEESAAITSELVKRINEDTRRIRIIEQRIDRVENSINALEDNYLTQFNDLKLSLEKLGNKMVSISEKLVDIESEMLRLNKELAKTATKREIKQMETFIDLINPVTAKFMTRDEMENFVTDLLKRKKT